jgi:hypothetical protein
LPPKTSEVFAALPTGQFACAVPARFATRSFDDHDGPPPLDAVIVFLHLTI